MRFSRDSFAAVLATAVVVVFVVLGFLRTHGPRAQRIIRTDETRVMQLSRLGNEIIEYYHKHDKKLQTALTDSQKKEYADPVTGTPPLYSTFSPNGFSLCSTFSADGPKDDKYGKYTFWKHGPGGKCYQFNADETLPAIPFHYF